MGLRVTVWHSDKPRERLFANAWKDGVLARGDVCELRPLLPVPEAADCDVAVMFGVKSRALFREHFNAGAHVIYVDKGYARHKTGDPTGLWEYWRVAVDAHQPTARLYERECPPDRWKRLGLTMKPWRQGWGGPDGIYRFVLAGSSQKYHDFYGLSDPTEWARKVVRALKLMAPGCEVIYRPKPSWKDAVPIPGSIWGGGDAQPLDKVLEGVNCLVTHGSNAVFDAMLAGVPQIVLGDAVTRQISTTVIEENPDPWPRHPSQEERERWAHNLAYFQWTLAEIAMGECWRWLRPMIYGPAG